MVTFGSSVASSLETRKRNIIASQIPSPFFFLSLSLAMRQRLIPRLVTLQNFTYVLSCMHTTLPTPPMVSSVYKVGRVGVIGGGGGGGGGFVVFP